MEGIKITVDKASKISETFLLKRDNIDWCVSRYGARVIITELMSKIGAYQEVIEMMKEIQRL